MRWKERLYWKKHREIFQTSLVLLQDCTLRKLKSIFKGTFVRLLPFRLILVQNNNILYPVVLRKLSPVMQSLDVAEGTNQKAGVQLPSSCLSNP